MTHINVAKGKSNAGLISDINFGEVKKDCAKV